MNEVIPEKCYIEQSLACSMNYGGRGHSPPLQIFLSPQKGTEVKLWISRGHYDLGERNLSDINVGERLN